MHFENTPNLSVIQRWFQSVITHPEGVEAGLASDEAKSSMDVPVEGLEEVVTRSSKLGAADRLAVYANAYYARLLECLGDVFPVLKRMLGEDVFEDFAFDYLQSFPSRSYTLHVLGAQFADFLSASRPPREDSGSPDWADFVVDLARFEWGIYLVFDGPGLEDQPPFPIESLARIPEHSWPDIRLQPAPCLRLIESRFPINDYFTTARRAAEGEPVDIPAPQISYTVLTRRDYVVRRRPLTAPQYRLLSQIIVGNPLGAAVATALENEPDSTELDPGQIQGWFRLWMSEGFFAGIQDA